MLCGCGADASAISHSSAVLAHQLREGSNALKTVHPLKRGSYHMFILMLSSFVDPLMFNLALEQNASKKRPIVSVEKTLFVW